MTVPYWVQDAIFYQIFPDRFADGNPKNNPPNVEPWGKSPNLWGFQGGDLHGVIQKFNYLLDLGITAIYFNPIFLSASNHGYNTTDYYRIDPKLGDMQDFRTLLEVAHRNDVRIIIDGVFNHCGRGFFAFNDILENGDRSPYLDWFHVKEFPLKAFQAGDAKNYSAWWDYKSLPKFNTDNPRVRRYLLDIARYWMEQGADGWRLDVPNEIDDDNFWADFRQVVKSVNRDAYILGEIWDGNPRWVGDNHFDGLMNYPVRDALIEFLQAGSLSPSGFADKVEGLFQRYPEENVNAMYVPLGSHDTERLMTVLDGNVDKVKLAMLFQFAYPGAPAIYYGDEIGLYGEKDPDCRRAFPWEPAEWNTDLREWTKRLITLRKRYAALRRGDYRRKFIDNRRRCYGFARTLGDQVILAVMNAGPTRRHLRVPVADLGWQDGRIVRDLLGHDEYIVQGDMLKLTIQPWSGVWVM